MSPKLSTVSVVVCSMLIVGLLEGTLLDSVLKKPTTLIQLEYRSFQNLLKLKKESSNTATVAFTAQLGGDLRNVKSHETIVYNHTRLNSGNSYDGKTGIFTAPTSGIYYFSWTILARPKFPFNTAIVINKSKHYQAYNHCVSSINQYRMCSKSVLLNLTTGDKVWIVAYRMSVEYAHGGTWPQFSGFKLA